jgi:hypothetical protein
MSAGAGMATFSNLLACEVDPGVVEVQWRSSASIVLSGTLGVLDTNRVKTEDHQ